MSNNRIDETGNKYGLLTVIKYAYTKNKRAYWLCKCECGNFVIVKGIMTMAIITGIITDLSSK